MFVSLPRSDHAVPITQLLHHDRCGHKHDTALGTSGPALPAEILCIQDALLEDWSLGCPDVSFYFLGCQLSQIHVSTPRMNIRHLHGYLGRSRLNQPGPFAVSWLGAQIASMKCQRCEWTSPKIPPVILYHRDPCIRLPTPSLRVPVRKLTSNRRHLPHKPCFPSHTLNSFGFSPTSIFIRQSWFCFVFT